MRNHHLKISIAVFLGILTVVVLGFAANLYIIGEPVDGAQLYCTTSVNGQTLDLHVNTVESAIALRDWKFKKDGNTLFIRARKVLVSPLFSKGDFQTSIDLEGIETVSLGGRVIWPNKD